MRRSVDGPAGRLKATDAVAICFLTGLEGPATIESLEIRKTSEPRKKDSDGEGRQSREGRSGHSAEDPPAVLGRAARSRPVQLMRLEPAASERNMCDACSMFQYPITQSANGMVIREWPYNA